VSSGQAHQHAVATVRAAAITAAASILLPLPPHDPQASAAALGFFAACAELVEHEVRTPPLAIVAASAAAAGLSATDASALAHAVSDAHGAVVGAAAAAMSAMAARVATLPPPAAATWLPVVRRCAGVCHVASTLPLAPAATKAHCRDALVSTGAIVESATRVVREADRRGAGGGESRALPGAPRLHAAPDHVARLVGAAVGGDGAAAGGLSAGDALAGRPLVTVVDEMD
jgi:hypothetical protein